MTFEQQHAMPDAPMPPPMPMTIRYDEEHGHLVTEFRRAPSSSRSAAAREMMAVGDGASRVPEPVAAG